jgi:hypothetical protein
LAACSGPERVELLVVRRQPVVGQLAQRVHVGLDEPLPHQELLSLGLALRRLANQDGALRLRLVAHQTRGRVDIGADDLVVLSRVGRGAGELTDRAQVGPVRDDPKPPPSVSPPGQEPPSPSCT